MKGAEFLETHQWSLAKLIGYEHPFLYINSHIVIHTWIILLLLSMLIIAARLLLSYSKVGRFLVLQFVSFFVDLTEQSCGTFIFTHCVFTASLFIFILLCNIASVIPWLDEPTRDLNTALALGIISFVYVQKVTIESQGLGTYLTSLCKPFFLWFPLNVISKLSTVISISFRLFGNIFGGSIITSIYFSAIRGSIPLELCAIGSGLNILIVAFFTLFEGALQAFVFAMLTLTYLSIGMQEGGGH